VALLATLASGGGGTFGIIGEIVWIVLLAAADLLLADTLLPAAEPLVGELDLLLEVWLEPLLALVIIASSSVFSSTPSSRTPTASVRSPLEAFIPKRRGNPRRRSAASARGFGGFAIRLAK